MNFSSKTASLASSQNHWQLGTAIENQVEIQSPAHAVLLQPGCWHNRDFQFENGKKRRFPLNKPPSKTKMQKHAKTTGTTRTFRATQIETIRLVAVVAWIQSATFSRVWTIRRGTAIVRTRWDPQKNQLVSTKEVMFIRSELSCHISNPLVRQKRFTGSLNQSLAARHGNWKPNWNSESSSRCADRHLQFEKWKDKCLPLNKRPRNTKTTSTTRTFLETIRSVAVVAVTSQQFTCYCLCQYMSNFLMLG